MWVDHCGHEKVFWTDRLLAFTFSNDFYAFRGIGVDTFKFIALEHYYAITHL